jgi:hypothetical protein
MVVVVLLVVVVLQVLLVSCCAWARCHFGRWLSWQRFKLVCTVLFEAMSSQCEVRCWV